MTVGAEVWFTPSFKKKVELFVAIFSSGNSIKLLFAVFSPLTMETMATERLTRSAYSMTIPVKLSSIRMCRFGGEQKPVFEKHPDEK